MELTLNQLKQLLPKNPYVQYWHEALAQLLPDYEINTAKRIAAFIAQCAHESAGFTALRENLNYRAESLMKVWPRHFPTIEIARQYAHNQERIANRAYANRMGNGDEASGDGWRYCGRGLIQLTGKNNYQAFADSLEMELEDVPEYLATFEGAAQSACWFWESNNLNVWADRGDILTLTKRINGGTIGLEDRIKHYNHALHVLGGDDHASAQPDQSHIALETVRLGSTGPTVQRLQEALGISADGSFGPGTQRALIQWQSANGLLADGIAGPATLSKLLKG